MICLPFDSKLFSNVCANGSRNKSVDAIEAMMRLETMTPMKVRTMRVYNDLIPVHLQTVAETAQRYNAEIRLVFGEALPKPLNVYIHGPLISFVIDAPNLRDQMIPGEQLPRITPELVEQFKFFHGQGKL
ncbi:hypothetical protein D3C74_398770 [compost metagenome]